MIDPELLEEMRRIRARHHSTQTALWHARVRLRIEELRERNLIDFVWTAEDDFNVKDYCETWTKKEQRKFKDEMKRGFWDIEFLMVYLGVGATSSSISTDDMHSHESLSWIVLPNSSSRRRAAQALEQQANYEEEVASGLKDFWIYDPDPLVMMANAARRKARGFHV